MLCPSKNILCPAGLVTFIHDLLFYYSSMYIQNDITRTGANRFLIIRAIIWMRILVTFSYHKRLISHRMILGYGHPPFSFCTGPGVILIVSM